MVRSKIHERATFLRDVVFSANDGIITTFAIVAGSAGASLSSKVVLVLGFANLFADGLSMASGNYLGVKSEIEYEKSQNHGRSDDYNPAKHGLVTFFSFLLAGFLPLSPYVFGLHDYFTYSSIIVVIALFSIGALRSIYTKRNWFYGGIEMLLIGGFAALVAYFIGFGLDKYVI